MKGKSNETVLSTLDKELYSGKGNWEMVGVNGSRRN